MTTATTAQTNRTKETAGAESELRAAARRRGLTMKGACGYDGRVRWLPVADCERGQAVDSQDAGEGRGDRWERSLVRGPSTARAAW